MTKLQIKKIDLSVGIIAAIIFIALSFASFPIFESLERILYGIEMRLDLSQILGRNKIAIVNIDEKSLDHLGPWPWPRSYIAEMIGILKNNGAKVIGLDLVFKEKERNQGLSEIRELYKNILDRKGAVAKDKWLIDSLKRIEKDLDNDSVLIKTVKDSGNVILPLMGEYGKYKTEVLLESDSFLHQNSLKLNDNKIDVNEEASVYELTMPYEELAENSSGMGHINLSNNKHMKGRTHLLFIDYRGNLIPSLALRIAADYLEKPSGSIITEEQTIQITDKVIPATNGEVFIKFKGAKRSFPYYSFVDILNVKKVPAVFDNKIVLIGYTAEGGATVNTPVDMNMPSVEFVANIVEDIINDQFLKRPSSVLYLEILIIFLLVMVETFFMGRTSSLGQLGIFIGLIFLTFIIGVISFVSFEIWFKTIYIGLALFSVLAFNWIRDFVVRQQSLGISSKESIETNRMLGLSLQSQGLLDLAFEKFRKCPLDDSMKDVIYNLGLDYERKRMVNKAISVYEYILLEDDSFRDLEDRIPKLKKMINPFMTGAIERKKEAKIVVSDDLGIKPTVGRYEIMSELGQGAMGVVYKAKDPKINRLLAIKTIRFSDEFEEEKLKEVKERFLKEAEIAGKLSHPGIVSIHDVGDDYDLTYLAMEFLEGDDLHKYSKKGSLLPLRKVLNIVAETATALDHAHKQGVIHRDIKPANIMLLKNSKVKVTDFGIAKAISSSQTKSGIVLGTPNYMSPEQINGQGIDGRSDIFSLGVVFFELLTGQLPFKGKNLTNLFYQITQGKHASARQINPKVPKPCEQIIDKALAKNPDKRFQQAGDFAKYLKLMLQKIDQVRQKGPQ